jgi:hypothetical protein
MPRRESKAFQASLVELSYYRRDDFFLARFLPGIIFFTALVVELAAFFTFRTARDMVDDRFLAFLAIVTSWNWTS